MPLRWTAGPLTFYCGFDPTAPSLHFGNLVQLVTMRRLQLAGHDPIAVVGGATGLIGDPSGRSAERNLNEAEVVADWVDRIRAQVERYLAFSGPHAARIVNNLEWTAPISALDLLRDVGKHFSVNRMLDKESVRARLEGQGISFTEFSYQLLQAFDYLELHRRYGCRLQTGGSDQWGNLTAGVDLIRRVDRRDGARPGDAADHEGRRLQVRQDGRRHALARSGADQPVRLLPVLRQRGRRRCRRAAEGLQLPLPRGDRGAGGRDGAAARGARRAAGPGGGADDPRARGRRHRRRRSPPARPSSGGASWGSWTPPTLAAAAAELPRAEVASPLPTVSELLVASGLAESRTAARRIVAEGGAYLNNRRVTDADLVPAASDLQHGRWLILRRGKRSLAAVEVTSQG